jgi:hypothetical protein
LLETENYKLQHRIDNFYGGINALLYSGDTELLKLATDDIKQITADELNLFGKIFNDIKSKTILEVLFKNIIKVSPEVEQTIKPHFDEILNKFN